MLWAHGNMHNRNLGSYSIGKRVSSEAILHSPLDNDKAGQVESQDEWRIHSEILSSCWHLWLTQYTLFVNTQPRYVTSHVQLQYLTQV